MAEDSLILLDQFVVDEFVDDTFDDAKLQLPTGEIWAHPWRNRDHNGWHFHLAARPGNGFNFNGGAYQKASCLLINSGRWKFYSGHNHSDLLFETGPDYYPSLHVRGTNFGDRIGSCLCVGW